MLLGVKRSSILSEFASSEQNFWFGISEKKVLHHVDTLYYTVSILGDKPYIEDDGLKSLISNLEELKQTKLAYPSATVDFFGFDVSMFGAAGGMYVYRLECPETFDIFFAKSIPNEETPRIQVQIRTHSLILDGLVGSIEKSFSAFKEILEAFDLHIGVVKENRIDYAFHTNIIQKPKGVFDIKSLDKHLLTPFRNGLIHFHPGHRDDEELMLDYIAIGSRKANYVFFRAYDKTQEVIEKNYKSFFLKRWFDAGLISRYDLYVYEQARVANITRR